MGCWNETCGLTHLPILHKDKIKVLILFQIKDDVRTCYYNESYAPLCFPIDGEYDDYGGIENIDTKSSSFNLNLKLLSKLKFFQKEDENEGPSESVTNQKSLLNEFVQQRHLYVYDTSI